MKPTFPILAAVAVAAAGGWYAFSGTNAVNSTPINPLVSAANAQSADTAEADAPAATTEIQDMTLGNPDSAVQIIEYASYTCPHCANFHKSAYKQLKKDFIDTGKVKFTYREVYFDRYGLWASMVARCAGPEKFFGITDLIFKGQREWTQAGGPAEIVEELKKIGRLAGIDNDQLEACMQDATQAQTLVSWYQENATRDEVNATPSFLLNGEKMSNQPYEDMKKLIEAQLEG